MQIVPTSTLPQPSAVKPAAAGDAPSLPPVTPGMIETPWKNPAAASALRSTVQMLATIEDGIVKAYSQVDRVRLFATDLHTTNEILTAASDAISSDASKDNDLFLPQLNLAGTGMFSAEQRLVDKNLGATWPVERGDILGAIRKARVITANVADQLDPNHQSIAYRGALELGQA